MTKNEALLLFALDPFYTEDELKEKWRFLVKHHHPDHGHNPEHFKRLVIALEPPTTEVAGFLLRSF